MSGYNGCPKCGDTGRIPVPCPDKKPGCLVAHYKRCPCESPENAERRERNEELE